MAPVAAGLAPGFGLATVAAAGAYLRFARGRRRPD
jgi:hypothetical protein